MYVNIKGRVLFWNLLHNVSVLIKNFVQIAVRKRKRDVRNVNSAFTRGKLGRPVIHFFLHKMRFFVILVLLTWYIKGLWSKLTFKVIFVLCVNISYFDYGGYHLTNFNKRGWEEIAFMIIGGL